MSVTDTPKQLMMLLLVLATGFGGRLGFRYIAEPDSIPRPWRTVVALGIGAVAFCVVTTLAQVVNALTMTAALPSTKRFLATVGTFSVVGAALGTNMASS